MSDKYYNLEVRKSIHINLTTETHAALRMLLFKRKLSMQEVLEECAIRLVENNEYFDKLMDDLHDRKQNKIEKKFTKTDAESIFNAIEQGNILEENNGDKK